MIIQGATPSLGTPPTSTEQKFVTAAANGNATDIVYVGDGPWDARTSTAMGMRFIGITGDAPSDRLVAHGASVCLNDYQDQDAFFDAVRDAAVPHGQQESHR